MVGQTVIKVSGYVYYGSDIQHMNVSDEETKCQPDPEFLRRDLL